jgi:hypothetical protein
MGYEVNVHVGVYIKVPKQVSVVQAPSKWYCKGNDQHKVKADYKFCPICGSDIVVETKDQTIFKDVRPWDIDCDDDWTCPESCTNIDGYAIWLPNRYDDPSQVSFEDVVKITPEMIAVMKASFNMTHRDLMLQLESMVEGVKAEFGVVKYWS